ncbi:hypothetical protein GDO81_027942 [Engystomops pustulosus]|uniref:Interferon-induced transmembrane protein n=1 Tax=Engystomops pustulosus TaxID=76066 RepID=A0AAV6ZN32_ENGPU|nr:hypothetical protein GDO81_027942 [Engystomops pustulosus]
MEQQYPAPNPPEDKQAHPSAAKPQYGQYPPPVGAPQYNYPASPGPQYAHPTPPGYMNPAYPGAGIPMQHPTPVLVTTQPAIAVVPQPAYKDYMPWSIVNMILFCLPLGILALVFSLQTKDAIRQRDNVTAAQRSRSAFTVNVVALVLGLCGHIAWIAYVIYIGVTAGRTYSYYYGYYG